MTALPRREFLWQALAACGSMLAAPAVARGAAQPTASTRALPSSRAFFAGRADAVRAIGAAYLRQLGSGTDRASILDAAPAALEAIARGRDERGAVRRLTRAVRDDFTRGRTVQLEGWILSRTEAELCALTLLDA